MRTFICSILIATFCAVLSTALIAGAAEPIRVGVMPFVSKVDSVSEQQISQMTEVTTRAIFGSKGISVIEREKLSLVASQNKINTNGVADTSAALKIGKLAGCQYMIIGSMTQLTARSMKINKGGRDIFGHGFSIDSSETEYTFTAEVEARIIDVATGRVIVSLPVKGEGSSIQNNMYRNDGTVRSVDPQGEASNLAIAAAGTKLGDRVREVLAGETPAIIDVSGANIRINRGMSSGVNLGAYYRAYREGADVLDLDGSSLGRKRTTLALLHVNNVNDEFSTAEVLENGGNVSTLNRGDKIEGITLKEAEALIESGIFSHVVAPSGADSIFASATPLETSDPTVQPEPDALLSPASDQAALTITPSASSPAPAVSTRPLENESTDPGKVVSTYALSAKDANICRISHINFRKLGKTQAAYDKFVELFDTYSSDYLAAYWLGEISVALKKKDQAATWYDKALAINPNYVPAQKAKAKLAK